MDRLSRIISDLESITQRLKEKEIEGHKYSNEPIRKDIEKMKTIREIKEREYMYYDQLVEKLDKIAEMLESQSCTKEAYEIDKIADAIEAMIKYPPEVINLAKELGINLNPTTAAEIVKKYLNPKITEKQLKEEIAKEAMLNISPKAKKLALLAAMLANLFVSQAKAEDKPIEVRYDNLRRSEIYTPYDLELIKKSDPQTFGIIMDLYNKQQQEAKKVQKTREQVKKQRAEMPEVSGKIVKHREVLTDEFGNEAELITYTDGSKELKGDMYYNPGVSYRSFLESKGEITKDPTAPRLPRKS